METVTPLDLFNAIKECGLYGPPALAAADRVAAAAADTAACADGFYELGVVTRYQFQKIRAGRAEDLLFGPYLLLDRIGEGGMGKVYRAVQKNVGRIVAIKMVRPQLLTNRTVISRYKREARAAAKLDHPNIVSLYDADDINGRYFLAMEYVDGIDLSRMVKQFGKPPTTGLADYHEAAEYVRQAALGLQHAHEHGLVHRDIKPGNLLVYGDRPLAGTAGRATVKVLDMGLVRSMMDAGDVEQTELTRDGTVVGTPDYMAPEQAKNSSTVNAKADLYSLGCTLYFLLRGQPLFPEGSPIDKLIRHQLDPAPAIRDARPDVPPGLAAIIEKLVKKKPDERYGSAAEVAAALAPFTAAGSGEFILGGVEETVRFDPAPFSLEPTPSSAGPPSITPLSTPLPGDRMTPPDTPLAAGAAAAGPLSGRRVRPAGRDTAGTAPIVDAEVVSPQPLRPAAVAPRTTPRTGPVRPTTTGAQSPPPRRPTAPTRTRPAARVRTRTRDQSTGLMIGGVVLVGVLVAVGLAVAFWPRTDGSAPAATPTPPLTAGDK